MTEQKFSKGDRVRIRPFDEIDKSDIGNIYANDDSCYSISRKYIDEICGCVFVIHEHSFYKGSHIYMLTHEDADGRSTGFCWAQGMLDFEFAEDLPEQDPDELFSGLIFRI